MTGATASATIQSPTNGCVALTTSKPVSVAVAWSPSSIHASVASFSGYAVVTQGGDIGFGLPNGGGSATVTGSFSGTDHGAKSTAATYSNMTSTQLLGACGAPGGVSTLTIASGSVAFS